MIRSCDFTKDQWLLLGLGLFFGVSLARLFAPERDLGGVLSGLWPVVRDCALIWVAVQGLRAYQFSAESRREHDRRVAFVSLHERRLAIIGDLYQKLTRTEELYEHATDVRPAPADLQPRIDEWGVAANEFRRHFDERRVWMDVETGALLDDLWSAMKEAGYKQNDYIRSHDGRRIISTEEWEEIFKAPRRALEEKFKPAKAAIEREFRRIVDAKDAKPLP